MLRLCRLLTHCLASMKSLIQTHKKEIDDFTNIDVEAVMKTTYLYEFDREIQ